MRKLPVIAAIPNYNMAHELSNLLPQLAEQGYSDIFVLDDASTDDSREVVADFGHDVHFIAGDTNVGAGGNRNRIISALGYDALIHFVDSDIDLITENTVDIIHDIVPEEPFGFVGGLVINPNGLQNTWNYGTRQCLHTYAASTVLYHLSSQFIKNPDRARWIRQRFSNLLADLPDPLTPPVRREVFWALEGNLVVRSDIFGELGGFDAAFREHEIQDLAARMSARGLKRYFDPRLAVHHREVEVRHYNRSAARTQNEFKIARKYGLHNWFLPNGKFKPEL